MHNYLKSAPMVVQEFLFQVYSIILLALLCKDSGMLGVGWKNLLSYIWLMSEFGVLLFPKH